MTFKVTHKIISLEYITQLFKKGMDGFDITKGKLWEGAYIIHTKIDTDARMLHLYYHDPINGFEVNEGTCITSVKESGIEFKTKVKL